mgnify:CR=1 FL=1
MTLLDKDAVIAVVEGVAGCESVWVRNMDPMVTSALIAAINAMPDVEIKDSYIPIPWGRPPEPVVNPNAAWCDECAANAINAKDQKALEHP